MVTRSTSFCLTFWMKVEYSSGRVACWRLPKLLNTDISTMAMTSHSRRFLVRLFKYYLLYQDERSRAAFASAGNGGACLSMDPFSYDACPHTTDGNRSEEHTSELQSQS